MKDAPIRVAVIGGGCAAMTTAFELSRPEHHGRYQVTVYQMGWRLGGKGASGRGPAGRIEEHGLHLWLGFYENAFRLMRECYEELGRDPRRCPISNWREAFKPDPQVAVVDRARTGHWKPWLACFPPGAGEPGDGLIDNNPFSVRGYLVRSAQLLVELLRSVAKAARHNRDAQGQSTTPRYGRRDHDAAARTHHPAPHHSAQSAPHAPRSAPIALAIGGVFEAVDRLVKYGQLATVAAVLEASELLIQLLSALDPTHESLAMRLVDTLAAAARSQMDLLVEEDDELRLLWQVADVVLAAMRGSLFCGLAFHPEGFDAINHYDYRQWLGMHGASQRSLQSGFVRGIYDLVFAFDKGDHRRPSLAAGVALRGAMRMFMTYRGALFWKMTAGMGDVVFAPLYELLKRRGVKFEFFHRLKDVSVADSEIRGQPPLVDALHFDVQATIVGDADYQPLVDYGGLPCWPSSPDYQQLVNGAQLLQEGVRLESCHETRTAGSTTLRVGDDFDLVVLGVSVGVLPYVSGQLMARNERWRNMVTRATTVATQAFQLWMREDMQQLGWSGGPVSLSGFVTPFDTWADMSDLIGSEAWHRAPRSLAYFCSVLPDRDEMPPSIAEDIQQTNIVRHNVEYFLDHHIGDIWPHATQRDGTFRYQILVDPQRQSDSSEQAAPEAAAAALDSQYWTANTDPSARYVLSAPGTIRYRISPLELICDNLTIAGDWTESGLDSGCVESAVMSGLLAAHAISEHPPLHHIIGYDHP